MAAITVNCAMTKTGCIHVVNLAAEANNGQVAPSHCHLVAVQNGGRTFTVLGNRLAVSANWGSGKHIREVA